jgi:acyl-coenzyme A synthetase/AMP-(fatty) acid ligase
VEDVINTHPAVLESAVIGVPDTKWVESVKAIIVLKKGKKQTKYSVEWVYLFYFIVLRSGFRLNFFSLALIN